MDSVKFKYRKKRKLKKKAIFILIVILLVLIGFIKVVFTKSINPNLTKDSYVETLSPEKEYLLNSTDPILKDLVEKSFKNPKINTIFNNIDAYPESLLRLASENEETIDFVANYKQYISSKHNDSISTKPDYKSGKIPSFLQWDKRWGYTKYGDDLIAITGCAPTSLAMVIVGLTGNTDINPKVIAEYSSKNNFYVNGVGSSWNLISEACNYFGLKSEEISLSTSSILSTLKNGHPIILTVKPGTFTKTGHFLVLTGVTSDNKIKINDPNSKVNSKKLWDIDVFINETKNLWKISS